VLMIGNALVADPRGTGLTFAVILAGAPVYWWRRRVLRVR